MDVKTSLLLRKNEWEHLQNMAMVKQSLIFTAVSLSKLVYLFFFGGGGEGRLFLVWSIWTFCETHVIAYS